MKHTTPLPAGVKIILGFHLLTLILWTIGQGGAVVSYDAVAHGDSKTPGTALAPLLLKSIEVLDFRIVQFKPDC